MFGIIAALLTYGKVMRWFPLWESFLLLFRTSIVTPPSQTVYEHQHEINYRIHPTSQWRAGEIIKENYWFVMPSGLGRKSVDLRIGVFDTGQKQIQVFESPLKDMVDAQGRVKIETFDPY